MAERPPPSRYDRAQPRHLCPFLDCHSQLLKTMEIFEKGFPRMVSRQVHGYLGKTAANISKPSTKISKRIGCICKSQGSSTCLHRRSCKNACLAADRFPFLWKGWRGKLGLGDPTGTQEGKARQHPSWRPGVCVGNVSLYSCLRVARLTSDFKLFKCTKKRNTL